MTFLPLHSGGFRRRDPFSFFFLIRAPIHSHTGNQRSAIRTVIPLHAIRYLAEALAVD
jgi:hypothetical protein